MNKNITTIVNIVAPLRCGKTSSLKYMEQHIPRAKFIFEDRTIIDNILKNKNVLSIQNDIGHYYLKYDHSILSTKANLIFIDQPIFATKVYDFQYCLNQLEMLHVLNTYKNKFTDVNFYKIKIVMILLYDKPINVFNRLNKVEQNIFNKKVIKTLNYNFAIYFNILQQLNWFNVKKTKFYIANQMEQDIYAQMYKYIIANL